MGQKICNTCEYINTITCEGCKRNPRYIDKYKPILIKLTYSSDTLDPAWGFDKKDGGYHG